MLENDKSEMTRPYIVCTQHGEVTIHVTSQQGAICKKCYEGFLNSYKTDGIKMWKHLLQKKVSDCKRAGVWKIYD